MLHHRRALEGDEIGGENLSGDARIRRRVENRMQASNSLYFNLLGFLAINGMLWAIWFASHNGFTWPLFITLPWGIWLVAQVMQISQYSPEADARREEEIQREVEAEKRQLGS